MLSRLAGESTPRSTTAKPNKRTSRAIGSIARQSHWVGSSFKYPLSLAVTDNSTSDTGLPPLAEFVQRHGRHHDDTEKDRLQPRVDVQEIERVAENGQEQRADGDDLYPADTAAQADPADHRGSDRLQHHAVAAKARLAGSDLRGQQDAGQSCQDARDDIGADDVALDRHAGHYGGLHIAADRVDIPAEERAALREHHRENHGKRDIDRCRQAVDLGATEAF